MKHLYAFIASLVFAFGFGVIVTLEAVEAHAELRVRTARRAAAACQQIGEPAPEPATHGGQS